MLEEENRNENSKAWKCSQGQTSPLRGLVATKVLTIRRLGMSSRKEFSLHCSITPRSRKALKKL